MDIKVFRANDIQILETEVNTFLESHTAEFIDFSVDNDLLYVLIGY